MHFGYPSSTNCNMFSRPRPFPDLDHFYRHLCLKEYFYDSDSEGERPQPEPLISRWTHAKNRDLALKAYIQVVSEDVHALLPNPG